MKKLLLILACALPLAAQTRDVARRTNGANPYSVVFFGTAAPGSVTGNLPGDEFDDTTNHNRYWCDATSGTAAPACTSVASGGWTLENGGGSGGASNVSGPIALMSWATNGGGALSGEAPGNANPRYQLFRLATGMVISSMSIFVDTAVASSHLTVGIYSYPCTSGTTLLQSWVFSSATTGAKNVAGSLTLAAGEYYVAVGADSAGGNTVKLSAYTTDASMVNLLNAGSPAVLSYGANAVGGTSLPANCGTLTNYSDPPIAVVALP